MTKHIDTIDELKDIKQWLFNEIENGEIVDVMAMYQPTVQLRINIPLDSTSVPKEITDALYAKFYTRNENES